MSIKKVVRRLLPLFVVVCAVMASGATKAQTSFLAEYEADRMLMGARQIHNGGTFPFRPLYVAADTASFSIDWPGGALRWQRILEFMARKYEETGGNIAKNIPPLFIKSGSRSYVAWFYLQSGYNNYVFSIKETDCDRDIFEQSKSIDHKIARDIAAVDAGFALVFQQDAGFSGIKGYSSYCRNVNYNFVAAEDVVALKTKQEVTTW